MVALLVAGLTLAGASAAATWRLDPGLSGDAVDATAPLQAVLDGAAEGDEIDGGGLTFRVTPGLVVRRSLTIRRLGLVQAGHDEGRRSDPWRVLEVRGTPGAPLRISLQGVRIDRGRSPSSGHPVLAAGLWLSHVRDSTVDDVEITGDGRGVGLMVQDVDGLQVNRLRVHDMTWGPCAADATRLGLADLARQWNDLQLQPMAGCELVEAGSQRIREPLAGVVIGRARRVTLRAPQIERLRAQLSDGRLLPWQTDGITVKSTPVGDAGIAIDSETVIEDARIEQVWEGIDINGLPARGIAIRHALIRDVHAFGIKAANGAQDVVVTHSRVERAGLAGFVVSGDGDARRSERPTHRIRVSDSEAIDTGHSRYWVGQATIAGFRFMQTARDASEVILERFTARDSQASPTMSFGVHAECAGRLQVIDANVEGAVRAPVQVAQTACH